MQQPLDGEPVWAGQGSMFWPMLGEGEEAHGTDDLENWLETGPLAVPDMAWGLPLDAAAPTAQPAPARASRPAPSRSAPLRAPFTSASTSSRATARAVARGDPASAATLTPVEVSKPRLRWTPELHDRFVLSVAKLGGLDVATPKAIVTLMGVTGMTIQHVKSHLQKFRLQETELAAEAAARGGGSASAAPPQLIASATPASAGARRASGVGGSGAKKRSSGARKRPSGKRPPAANAADAEPGAAPTARRSGSRPQRSSGGIVAPAYAMSESPEGAEAAHAGTGAPFARHLFASGAPALADAPQHVHLAAAAAPPQPLYGAPVALEAQAGSPASPAHFDASHWDGLDEAFGSPGRGVPPSHGLPYSLPEMDSGGGADGGLFDPLSQGAVQQALALQVHLQGQLYESLEAQRKLQARFEEHTRYLASIVEQQQQQQAMRQLQQQQQPAESQPLPSPQPASPHPAPLFPSVSPIQHRHMTGGERDAVANSPEDEAMFAAVAEGFAGREAGPEETRGSV